MKVSLVVDNKSPTSYKEHCNDRDRILPSSSISRNIASMKVGLIVDNKSPTNYKEHCKTNGDGMLASSVIRRLSLSLSPGIFHP
jgi:hypothetical protein